MSWSARRRGNVTRNQTKTKITAVNLSANQTAPGMNSRNGSGSHPPRNSTVVNEAMAKKYTYSASMKNAQRKPEYSTWKPATSSDSASGKSNGTRFSSAVEAIRNTMKAIGCQIMNQPFFALQQFHSGLDCLLKG